MSAMTDHLAGNVTFFGELWKMVARDGTVAAFSPFGRDFSFGGVTYLATGLMEITKNSQRIGLEANTGQLRGYYGDIVTEADVNGGRWKRARITREWVDYFNSGIGSVDKQVGYAGKFFPSGGMFEVEFFSQASLLGQLIGDLTGPIDRRTRLDELGINIASFTHATTVASFTDRRKFKVSYVQPSADYFKGGLAIWTSGANALTPGMEVKASTTTDSGTRTEIELQLPMMGAIANGDGVTLYRGYDGTRDSAKALGAMLGFEGEPDMPGWNEMLTYPE